MSVIAMGWAKGRAPTIAGQAVLFALADYADEWGVTYVGQDTLARDCSCRKATVSENLARLEQLGLIARVRRHDNAGRRTSDHVVLAPLAKDRGGMRDADKRATEKHPETVVELARTQDTPTVSSPDTPTGTRQDTPHGGLDTPRVPEPSEEPSGQSGAKAPACPAREDADLPDDFPAELKPHLRAVHAVLLDLAVRHEAKRPALRSLAQTLIPRRLKPLVRSAYDFAAWADGRARRQRDVIAGYRNWIDREDDLATVERLAATTADEAPNVVRFSRPPTKRLDRWAAGYDKEVS